MFHFIVVLLFSCSDSEKNYSFGGSDDQNEDSGTIDSDIPEEDTAESIPQDTAENQGTQSCDTLTLSSTITVDSCSISPESGAISYLEEWSIEEFMPFPEYNHILSVPVVVQLGDDNGDGRISQEDTADIVFITDDGGLEPQTHGVLRIVSEGELLYSAGSFESDGDQAYPYRYSGISIADINLDGWPEIVGVTEIIPGPTGEEGEGEDPNDDSPVRPNDPSSGNNCYVFAADREANLLWIAREASFACGGHHPAIADLEGDGSVEVVVGNTIIAGEDGTVVAIGDGGDGVYEAYEGIGSITVVHDLDLDGEQEIIAGNTIYDAQGNVRCSLEVSDGFAGVADLNQDGMGEWVVVGNGEVAVADVDCNQLAGWELLSWGTGGPPTIDDFDMDGEMEIAISDANIFAVYEVDGSLLWSTSTTDESSHATGAVAFDLEGDGRVEILYADEFTFWIFDGMTGAVRLEDTEHSSRTLHEYPTVVDIDSDGYPEIVIPNGGSHGSSNFTGLRVIGSPENTWIGGPLQWNQHAFYHDNINADLTVPETLSTDWPQFNGFRSANLNPISSGEASDAVIIADYCTDFCSEDQLKLAVRIGNRGGRALRSGLKIELFTQDGDGVRTLLEERYTTSEIRGGETSVEEWYELSNSELKNGGLLLRVDHRESQHVVLECNEDNNLFALPNAYCP